MIRIASKHLFVAALVFATGPGPGASAFAADAAQTTEIAHWPCKAPYKETLTPEEIWGGTPPAADGDWHRDEGVRKLVTYVTSPETAPASGRQAIADLAKQTGDAAQREHTLALAFRGMVDETNVLRHALLAGIRNSTIRGVILGDAVKEDDKMMAELPKTAESEARRQDIKAARRFNFRNKDDAEDEADFLCYRVGYVEKKLRALTDQVRHEVGG
jgi:hypothetical protein